MYKKNLFTYLINTTCTFLPYLYFTRFNVLSDVKDIITIRSFLLIGVTFLIGGIPTSFNIHQKKISTKIFYKIFLIIVSTLIIIYYFLNLFNFKVIEYFNIQSIIIFGLIIYYELCLGFFKSLLKININLIAALIRLLFVFLTILLISKQIIIFSSSKNAFLFSLSIGYLISNIFYLFALNKTSIKTKINLNTKSIFKSSIPHYINIFIQSIISNIDRLIIASLILPIELIDYDFILIIIGSLFSLIITPLTQLFHPSYMNKKNKPKEGELIIKKLADNLYQKQLKLVLPISIFIYSIAFLKYTQNIEPITLSLISIGTFIQSFALLSCVPFYYNGKDYIHTIITIISAFFYIFILKFMVLRLGLLGAPLSRLLYFILAFILGFLVNKFIKNKFNIINFKNQIFIPILKISTLLFLINFIGLKFIYLFIIKI